MNTQLAYTIQEISEKTGLPTSTLRYYEEMGLLERVGRAANGHRRYDETDLGRVEFVKKLRSTSMSLDSIRDFLTLYRRGASTASQRREILEMHRQTVQARLDELIEMLGFIDYKIGLYQDEEADYEREQLNEISVVG